MFTSSRRKRWLAFLAAPILALGMGLATSQPAYAHGGHGGFGGGHFGGGHFGGHIGGFGGFGRHVGGFGGLRGFGGFNRGFYGRGFYGLGGLGYFGLGGLGYGLGGFGWGYPYYGYTGLGYGYPWYGYGYSYPYYGYGYSVPYYGYAYNDPYYGYGYGYGYPYSGYLTAYPATSSYSSAYVAPALPAPVASENASLTPSAGLGIEAQQVLEANGQEAMRVLTVYPGTPADKAGLAVGDKIESANGYLTQTPENVVWIIKNAAPSNVLKMTVRTAKDGLDHTVTATLQR
jgi:hypothetical protein